MTSSPPCKLCRPNNNMSIKGGSAAAQKRRSASHVSCFLAARTGPQLPFLGRAPRRAPAHQVVSPEKPPCNTAPALSAPREFPPTRISLRGTMRGLDKCCSRKRSFPPPARWSQTSPICFFWLASRVSRAFEPRKGHGKTACGCFWGYAPPTVPRAEYIRGCDN